ncbi:MAG: tetraacyldisaccharide 4'-kinase [Paracoccaceae bacterium]|nr:tetraacyldisaccharide 4'-kinase [Paracoccaceae bacterium]
MLFPYFWLKPKFKSSFFPYLLYPISLVWMAFSVLNKIIILPYKSPVPIICVGNITVGGNGKTPTAIKLRSLLKELGYNPHILSRGYKASLKGPHFVNPTKDSFREVGDEALMMSMSGPTWISRNRRLGIKSAIASDADIIILDDGFQNNSIKKDFSILVIEASIGFGNGYLIPAGPLRENIKSGLNKANLIITLGEKSAQTDFANANRFIEKLPKIKGRLVPETTDYKLKDRSVIAFAGIAHPKKFKTTLETLGANIIIFKKFTNHKAFKINALENLIMIAEKKQAILVTTEKDFVRIPKHLQHNFQVIKVNLEIQTPNLLIEKLKTII